MAGVLGRQLRATATFRLNAIVLGVAQGPVNHCVAAGLLQATLQQHSLWR